VCVCVCVNIECAGGPWSQNYISSGLVFVKGERAVAEGSKRRSLVVDDNVIDWNVNQFDEKADEAHDGETDGGSNRNLFELFAVRLGTTTNQTHRIAGELFHRFNERNDLIHFDCWS
jgi:hypothetical protein